ncbi:diphthine methyl ester synthase isoform X2 [Bacillus rossius redtenbacheri]|uniref:diphthine methyl ester synthase isoform X2 n=1 Tax=Bacillus rossius redtenbacheri TaxID=93214 RepID=UPI002FDD05A7
MELREEFYGRPIIVADRDLVEQGADLILKDAADKDVAFLVVGDPFGATTHADLVLRAKEAGIRVEIIHNASIMNAIACCGLQLYSFGEAVSIPYWTETWKPDSFYDKIAANRRRGLHTLCLLDIQVKEPTPESLTRKTKTYLPPRFMSVGEAAHQLLEIIGRKCSDGAVPEAGDSELAYTEDTLCVGVARVGSASQKIVACRLQVMKDCDLGPPLHSLVIPGRMQVLEMEYIKQFVGDEGIHHSQM